MVAPAAERKAVVHLMEHHGMSERRACKAIGCCRMTVRYQSTRPDDRDLRERMTALARERASSEQLLRQQREEAAATSAAAQHEAAAQRARADALEQQLARLGDLPAAVQASLAQARPAKRLTRTTKTSAGKPKAPHRRAS